MGSCLGTYRGTEYDSGEELNFFAAKSRSKPIAVYVDWLPPLKYAGGFWIFRLSAFGYVFKKKNAIAGHLPELNEATRAFRFAVNTQLALQSCWRSARFSDT